MDQGYLTDLSRVISNVSGIAMCYYFFGAILTKKSKRLGAVAFATAIILAINMFSNSVIENLTFNAIAATVTYTLLVLWRYEGQVILRALSGLFFTIFGVITELIVAYLLLFTTSMDSLEVIESEPLVFFAGTILSKLLMLLVIWVVLRQATLKQYVIPIPHFALLLSIPVISLVISILMTNASRAGAFPPGTYSLTFVALLMINIITYGLYESIYRNAIKILEYKYANEQLKVKEDYYGEIIDNYRDKRQIYHDMNNHFIAISGYIRNKKYDMAEAYSDKLIRTTRRDEDLVFSNNDVLNAILVNKMTLAKSVGIHMSVHVTVSRDINIDAMDVSIIIGNALDNAIEACQRIDTGKDKSIYFGMGIKQNMLIMRVTNDFNPASIKEHKGRFLSSKEGLSMNGHGIGLTNLKKAVEKYQGNVTVKIEKNQFVLKAIIPL